MATKAEREQIDKTVAGQQALFVGSLATSISDEDLCTAFEKFGDVITAKVRRDCARLWCRRGWSGTHRTIPRSVHRDARAQPRASGRRERSSRGRDASDARTRCEHFSGWDPRGCVGPRTRWRHVLPHDMRPSTRERSCSNREDGSVCSVLSLAIAVSSSDLGDALARFLSSFAAGWCRWAARRTDAARAAFATARATTSWCSARA
jgi:hypothetical protein